MDVWILGMLISELGIFMNTRLTVIIAVHLLNVAKMIASQAPATQVQTFLSLAFIRVYLKLKSLVFSRNMVVSKAVRS